MKELTFSYLARVDIIEVTQEDISSIQGWLVKNINYIKQNINIIKDPFDEINIIYVDNLIYKNKNEFYNFLEPQNNSQLEYIYGFHLDFEKSKEDILNDRFINFDFLYDEESEYKNKPEFMSKAQEWIKQDILTITLIYVYIALNKEYIIRQTKTTTKKIQSKKNKRAGKKPRTKLIKQTIIKLNTEHIQLTEQEKRDYERHIAGWTVRGHLRHYQSGKTVWIKPHVRGDKDNVEGKIYEV
jgi:hypothetical protein